MHMHFENPAAESDLMLFSDTGPDSASLLSVPDPASLGGLFGPAFSTLGPIPRPSAPESAFLKEFSKRFISTLKFEKHC